MRTFRTLIAVPLVVVTALPSLASAQGVQGSEFRVQRHVVDPAAIASEVGRHVAKQDADRAAVREALSRPKVREVAAKTGIDLNRLTAAVDTMNGSALERAADAARHVNQSLVGGQSRVTISTTTIIIGLLVLILIIVAVD